MTLETIDQAPIDNPSADSVRAAVGRVVQNGGGEVQLRRSAKHNVTVQLSSGDRFYIYVERMWRPRQSKAPVSQTIAEQVILSFLNGRLSIPPSVRMEPMAQGASLQLNKVRRDRMTPSQQEASLRQLLLRIRLGIVVCIVALLASAVIVVTFVRSPFDADSIKIILGAVAAAAGIVWLMRREREIRMQLKNEGDA